MTDQRSDPPPLPREAGLFAEVPHILEQRPYPTADGQCLLITGPGRICGRRRDDPVHQEVSR